MLITVNNLYDRRELVVQIDGRQVLDVREAKAAAYFEPMAELVAVLELLGGQPGLFPRDHHDR